MWKKCSDLYVDLFAMPAALSGNPSPLLRKYIELYVDGFVYMPAAPSGSTSSMLQELGDPEPRVPVDPVKIQKLLKLVTRLRDPRAAQKLSSDERLRLGAERGRKKGTAATKARGEETSARIVAYLEKTSAKPTDRGLAQRIAGVLDMDRSTVSRYLNKLKKRK
jgi:hypothetical protein